jgi:hypothetical protein
MSTNWSRDAESRVSVSFRMRRKAVVDQWRAAHGDTCPGFGARRRHVVVAPNRLTADHVIPVSLGGDPAGELRVLCAFCNTSRGGANRLRPRRRKA